VKPDYALLTAPVLGIFGAKDSSVNADAIQKLEHAIATAGGKFEKHVYPADHAFFNDTRPEVYDATHAAAAWKQTTEFFARHL
jgi:carboxymethylenebutenolidase